MLGGVAGQPASSTCRLPGEFTEPSISFYILWVLGKVLSVSCHHKCPFCIMPAPAGGSLQPTMGCTFISARTFQKKNMHSAVQEQSASPTYPCPLPQK